MTNTTKTGIHLEDGIGHRLQEAGERLVELKDEAADKLGKRVDSLGALVKQHPLAALGLGIGVGYLIARLLHR